MFWKENTRPEVEDASSTSHPEVNVWVRSILTFLWIFLFFEFESGIASSDYSFSSFETVLLIFVSDAEEVPTTQTDCSPPPKTLSSFRSQLPFVSSPPLTVFPSRAVLQAWTEDRQSLFRVVVVSLTFFEGMFIR